MAHSFLIAAGRWTLEGYWLERSQMPMIVQGRTLVAWSRDNWFTMVTKLAFPESEREDISFQYRGRLDGEEQYYTYILQQSQLGRIEGEGWIAPNSIIQRYWVRGDHQRRSGFETFYQIDPQTYQLSSGILTGHHLTSTMEAKLKRQD
ncbi:MAG: hypothetical protein AB4058_08035 [Microcystaceae cyanobacterium]